MKPFFVFWLLPLFFVPTGHLSWGQTTWTKYQQNPVLSPGVYNGVGPYGIDGAFDVGSALSPSVIVKNGIYKMWYVGYEGYWTGKYTIGCAISEDGTVWHAYTKNPILTRGSGFDNSQVWLSVVLPDSVLKMYYSGSDGARWTVGIATSTNGIAWTKFSGNPVLTVGSSGAWDDNSVWGVSVVKMSSTDYRMWYSGAQADGRARIGYATSPNGIQWTKHAGNPVLTFGPSGSWESQSVYVPRVVFANDRFHMFYLGRSNATQIGYAYSSDGVQWTKHANNPVIPFGSPGQWDSNGLIDHCVLLEGNALKLWYGGASSSQIWQIGLATSTLITDVPAKEALPTTFRLNQNFPNPFNPTTTIQYDVPERAHIMLKVYNALGQDVATLVDEERVPGTYSAVWDASGVASGTYWSRMTADGKSVVQKMILLK